MITAAKYRRNWYSYLEGDKQIWSILLVLSLVSIPVVLSSIHSLSDAGNQSPFIFLLKQLRNISMGLVAAILVYRIPIKWFNTFAAAIWVSSLVLLLYTGLFGPEINSARRWVEIPLIGLSFQASDYAKIALIILIAQRIASTQLNIKKLSEITWPILVPVLITLVLIAPFDMSNALLLFMVVFTMMFVGRINLKLVFATVLFGIFTCLGIYFLGNTYPSSIRSSTWEARITNFMEDTPNYQIRMRQQAVSNGGFWGVGPGKSLNKNYYNSPFTDFIYAVICEEFGFIGAIFILFIYLWFFWRVFLLVMRKNRAFGALLAFGLGTLIVYQAFLNMMVTLNLLPSTGLPLPMISLGGTSNLFTGIAFGIILSVSRIAYREEANIEIKLNESDH